MSEQLWSDERIQEAIHSSRMTKGTFDTIFAARLAATIRNEYEARIARMNDQSAQLAEVQEERIAELEGSHAALVADQLAVARLLNDVGIEHSGYKNQAARVEVLIERLRTSQRNVISIAKERNELEAKLATSEELAEQHLAEIDSLERQLRDTEIGVRKLVGLQP